MIVDQISWDNFVLAHGPKSGRFLQSWEWGEFQRAMGASVRREVFEEGGEIVGIAQLIGRKVRWFGRYEFCPKGPVLKEGCKGLKSRKLFDGDIFLRVEPDGRDFVVEAKKTIDINPSHTWITDLSRSEEELLAGMHQKARYKK